MYIYIYVYVCVYYYINTLHDNELHCSPFLIYHVQYYSFLFRI